LRASVKNIARDDEMDRRRLRLEQAFGGVKDDFLADHFKNID